MFFLSYAMEDSGIADEIAGWFRSKNIEIFDWQAERGGRFIPRIEAAIRRAQGYIALLSPSFLASDWCEREMEIALQRERALQTNDPRLVFVHVVEILETPNADAGFLGGYDWVDFTNGADRTASFSELNIRIEPQALPESAPGSPGPVPAPPGTAASGLPAPVFRNREDELEKVVRALTTTGGPHFWLVIAPPKLGKTWFLGRVGEKLTQSEPHRWVAKRLDIRELPDRTRDDAAELIAQLFERTFPITDERRELVSIAQEIIRTGEPCLCLLDHAELLDKKTAATLRSYLTQIYHHVQDAHKVGVQLGLIVASRREDGWRGVTPDPRLAPLPLTEFKVTVVHQALHELAVAMKRDYGINSSELRRNSILAHRLTEGLPALLVKCLEWIHGQEWFEMDRLESQELFDELTETYIREGLLAQESLLPEGQEQAGASLTALEQAYRVLAPFRLFTRSHLSYYLEYDLDFREALESQQWSMEDLWGAISDTALLARPLDEPWKEIHAAIRRLLHRHYYKSADQRAGAHSEARKFVEVWADQQSGKEQAIGLVECLWHEAMALRMREAADMEQQLCASAGMLSRQIRESPAYTPEELRRYATDRMGEDAELQETVSNIPGLFTMLVELVSNPPQEL